MDIQVIHRKKEIPPGPMSISMALTNKLSNPPIAGVYVRKFPLLPKLLQHG
jgi:hypothetical protein